MFTGIVTGIAFCMAVFAFLLMKQATMPARIALWVKKELERRDYGKLERRIQSSGLTFDTKGKMTPVLYIGLRFALALTGSVLSAVAGAGIGGVAASAGLGYMLPDSYLFLHKRSENKKMLDDIEHLYNLMHLQRRAGAYIVDTITDSYRVVHTWRLKKALLELAGALNGKKPVREAVDEFAAKFDSPYITTLADIVKHTIESGDTAQMLEDVAEQIASIQQTEYIMVEGRQEMEVILFMTLLFVGMAACMVYLMAMTFQGISGGLF